MTPEHVDLLVHTLHAFAWVVGIATTVLTTVIGGSVIIVWKTWSKRVDSAEIMATRAHDASEALSVQVANAATHCATMRADCRAKLMETFATSGSMDKMDLSHQQLLEKALNAMQADVITNREMVTGQYRSLKESLQKFKDEIWDAFHKHKHTEDGQVVRGT